jgi:twitching motility protein PilT
MLKRFNELIVHCAQNGYSDLHITGGQPVVYRKDGQLHYDHSRNWNYRDCDQLVKNLFNARQIERLRERFSVDFAASISHIRIRINIFNTIGGLSLAIRLLPGTIPNLDKLNLHPSMQAISELKAGLVLVCGTTGCGKSTTIASILDEINHKRAVHIITLEDPIEYRIKSNKSFIEQREIGTHVPSVEQGLIDVMRADPDVIMVGELRDSQTMRLTLNAAESGHLVIGTLHATNIEDAIYRIINSVPPEAEEYIRYQLASTISWVIVQQFMYMEKIGFRVPLLSILRGTQQIKGIIRERKLHQLDNAMHTSKNEGMFTADRYQQEYLNSHKQFYNPAVFFKPSEETIQDTPFHSSIIFDQDFGRKSISAALLPNLSKNNMAGNAADQSNLREEIDSVAARNFDYQYVIDESPDLEEIIAETENKLNVNELYNQSKDYSQRKRFWD